MRRRTFLKAFGGFAAGWPLSSDAQQGDHIRASSDIDLLQQAVNYIFTGRVELQSGGPEIVNRMSCGW